MSIKLTFFLLVFIFGFCISNDIFLFSCFVCDFFVLIFVCVLGFCSVSSCFFYWCGVKIHVFRKKELNIILITTGYAVDVIDFYINHTLAYDFLRFKYGG